MVEPYAEHGLEQKVRGIVPVKLLRLKSRVCTFVIVPSTLGTGPLMLQPRRSNSTKLDKEANEGGIVALDMTFPVKYSWVRAVCAGMNTSQ